jgi:hypothetical protein
VDDDSVKQAFQDAIGGGSGVAQVMSQVWRDADFLAVERRVPEASRLGKIQHLHSARAEATPE